MPQIIAKRRMQGIETGGDEGYTICGDETWDLGYLESAEV